MSELTPSVRATFIRGSHENSMYPRNSDRNCKSNPKVLQRVIKGSGCVPWDIPTRVLPTLAVLHTGWSDVIWGLQSLAVLLGLLSHIHRTAFSCDDRRNEVTTLGSDCHNRTTRASTALPFFSNKCMVTLVFGQPRVAGHVSLFLDLWQFQVQHASHGGFRSHLATIPGPCPA
jgi:hypothetical protein